MSDDDYRVPLLRTKPKPRAQSQCTAGNRHERKRRFPIPKRVEDRKRNRTAKQPFVCKGKVSNMKVPIEMTTSKYSIVENGDHKTRLEMYSQERSENTQSSSQY